MRKEVRDLIIQRDNNGIGTARDLGLNGAQGEYLFFLDSDDIYNIFTYVPGKILVRK